MSVKLTSVLTSNRARPGGRLVSAAITGLLAAGGAACGDDADSEAKSDPQLDDEELSALCKDEIDDAVKDALDDQDLEQVCSDMVADAKSSVKPKAEPEQKPAEPPAAKCPKPDVEKVCAEVVQQAEDVCKPFTATADEKTTSSEQKEYKFAELTKKCDERGGYVQIHAACGGVNACQGFSFGDWGPDGALVTEHSCSGANGCLGLSCIIGPKDSGKTGAELYEMEFPEPGPGNCNGCHAERDPETGEKIKGQFVVYVFEGSTRTVDNWLERTPAEQERVTAFGTHGITPEGIAYANMAAYNKVLSRGEIERVVAHLRTLKPAMKIVKDKDLPAMMAAEPAQPPAQPAPEPSAPQP